MSEIFWEALEHMLEARLDLMRGPISPQFMNQNAERYAKGVHDKCQALTNCVGFIDGTVLGIARQKGYTMQRIAYKGHKRNHALKFQAVNSPDGLIMNGRDPIEGRRHDWTLYTRSGLETHLPEVLDVEGERYCIFGDSGYIRRWFTEISFQGSNLSVQQVAFNKAMSSGRITVE